MKKIICMFALLFFTYGPAYAQNASWYDSQSVCKEGTCCGEVCPTASGVNIKSLEHEEMHFCAASKNFKMGSILKVTNKANGRSVLCKVMDRGGFAKYQRAVDLSKHCFAHISDVDLGVVDVTIDVVREGP